MLSDFGISTKLTDADSRRKTVVGTPYWMAPEILLETACKSCLLVLMLMLIDVSYE